MSKENQRLTGVDQKPAFLDGLSIKARDIFSNLKGFKDVDSKDIHIEGIDPKRYGSFDRTMNYVTGFFNKRRVAFAALLTLTSCTTGGVIGVSVLTSEPRETSTLPGDSTKTPESPTEATYELTQTPGHESTINPPTASPTPESTATATEIPATATEKPLIEGNIFFDPQSKEDFKEVVLAPSPIDEPEKFALWREEYLRLVNEKLINYDGPVLEFNEYSAYDPTYGLMGFYAEKFPVVGSYRFKWWGEDVLNKTYIFSRKDGGDGYILLNVTYLPESIAKMHGVQYDYGTLEEIIGIEYVLTDKRNERWHDEFSIDFYDVFPKTEEQLDSLFRIFFRKSEKGDGDIFSQMQFLCMRSE